MRKRAYKLELKLTSEQRSQHDVNARASKYCYNWALGAWRRQYRWHSIPKRAGGLALAWGLTQEQAEALAARAATKYGVGAAKLALKSVPSGAPRGAKSAAARAVRDRYPYAAPPDAYSLHAELVRSKAADPALAWLHEASAYAIREAVDAVGKAYSAFFRRLKKHAAGDHSECFPEIRNGKARCTLGEPRFKRGAARRWICNEGKRRVR